MTYFHTCVGCESKGKDCVHLAALKNAIRLTGITSVKHICKVRVPAFAPGDQVLVEVFMYNAEDDEHYHPVFGKFRGVFIQQKGTKAICFIKPGTVRNGYDPETCDPEDRFTPNNDGTGYVKVLLGRIKRIEGAEKLNMEECELCGRHTHITGITGTCSEWCQYTDKCLAKALNNKQVPA
jgi:hypothetical protein